MKKNATIIETWASIVTLFGKLARGGTVRVMLKPDKTGLDFEIIEAPHLPAKVKVKGEESDGDEETEPNEPELVK